MVTLGLYEDDEHSAAAVAVHGRLISAIRITDREEGPAPRRTRSARERALHVARVSPHDVDGTVTVNGVSFPRRETPVPPPLLPWFAPGSAASVCVDRHVAQAAQLRAGLSDDVVVVVLDDDQHGDGAFVRVTPSTVQPLGKIGGAQDLLRAMSRVSEVVGVSQDQPFAALDMLAEGDCDCEGLLSEAFRIDGSTIRTDFEYIEHRLRSVQAECPADLAGPSAHVRVERARRALASGITHGAARVITQMASHVASQQGVRHIAFTGASCASAAFAGRVSSESADARFAPVTESIGGAIGAALLPQLQPQPLFNLAVGPAFTDDEVKAVLDNCRLEYVYEPQWNRLHCRVSQLLKTGALVAWFQGRSEFGGRSLGNRSVLCDPSGRYARENVNVYLMRRQLGHVLSVSLAPSAASHVRFEGDPLRFVAATDPLLDTWRQPLAGALYAHGRIVVHMPSSNAAPELTSLLETHREQAGVPGLINVPLLVGEAAVDTPRDAIRSMFGSPVDVLVIGRFLVSKDYWMIRRQ
jgi:predicted NodU family carbamoyl transferase